MRRDKTKQVVNRHEFIFNLEATKTNQLLEQSLGLILGPYTIIRVEECDKFSIWKYRGVLQWILVN